ncbi:MAG: LacI family DNA-binding transcriptional regulator [Pseudomonadota bacterium]
MRRQRDKVDILAVAKAAGVSPATVSRAFNHPEIVKPPTRKRVEKAVAKLGYIRNRAAQTIHGRRSGTVGLIVPTITNSIFSEVVQAFSDQADQAGFAVLMATHGYDLGRELHVLRKFLEHRVDGVALIGLDHRDAAFTLLERQGVPSVAMWSFDPASRLSCFGADNAEAGRLAAQHLLGLGHHRIGLAFAPTAQNERARYRGEGAMAALREAQAPISDAWRIEAVYNVALAKQAILNLLQGEELPTALLCGNDIIAQGALLAALHVGLSVPKDISIMGIGDFPGSADLEPGLCTVRIPATRIGQSAGAHLAGAIRDGAAATIHRERFDVALRVRATTAPP